MSEKKFDVTKFFDEGNEIARSITEEDIVEEQMFQMLESNIIKILNLSSQSNGYLVKLMLMSNILNKYNLSYIEFDFEFISTYLQYSKEKFHFKMLSEVKTSNQDTPYRDKCIADNPYIENENSEISSEFKDTFEEKLQDLTDDNDNDNDNHNDNTELNENYELNDPSFNGRIYHLLEQREKIKSVFFSIFDHITSAKDSLFITALILFEMENLSANEYYRTLYYEDLHDKINPKNQWFACLDVTLELSQPQVFIQINNGEKKSLTE